MAAQLVVDPEALEAFGVGEIDQVQAQSLDLAVRTSQGERQADRRPVAEVHTACLGSPVLVQNCQVVARNPCHIGEDSSSEREVEVAVGSQEDHPGDLDVAKDLVSRQGEEVESRSKTRLTR